MPRRKQTKSKEPDFALNWQRKARGADKMPLYKFDEAVMAEDLLSLTLQDNTTLSSGDFCYVVNNAGDPFAIGRIMEFVRSGSSAKVENQYSARLNWLYRPNSIHKKAQNTRELLLTMHSDTVPLDSLRPKVMVANRHEIENLEKYIEKPNCFWFDRYWDRYISRFYDAVPTTQITNIPPELGPIIRSRFKFLILEPQRTKQLTEAPQFCSVCDLWCSEMDSVHCVDCDQFFHRGCTNPPIANPLRGYSWSCGPCTVAHEKHLERQRGPDLTMRRKRSPLTAEKRQLKEQKEAEIIAQQEELEKQLEKEYDALRKELIPECKEIEQAIAQHNQELTPSQVRFRHMWPFRYLGVNSNIKDVFDLDDRIHPRAISRVGGKHQANVPEWPGRPIVYYRKIVPDRRKRGPKSKSVSKDQIKYEPDDLDHSLPWVQEAPAGYIERGSSKTAELMWDPSCDGAENAEKFLEKTQNYAEPIGVHHTCPNFIDACLYEFMKAPAESEALTRVSMFTKKHLKEPTFTDREVEKFEKAVAIHGNNLHEVFKSVRTKSAAEIVRFYYLWKKTEGGHRVWDNCQARLSRNRAPLQNEEFIESIRDEVDPVLNYSTEAIKEMSKSVYCKFCETTTSREWRVAPHVVLDSQDDTIEALCSRCSRIWYRYAIPWLSPEHVLELNANKLTRFRVEPELLEDATSIMNEREKFLEKHQSAQHDVEATLEATPTHKRGATSKESPTKRRRTRRSRVETYEDASEESQKENERDDAGNEASQHNSGSDAETETVEAEAEPEHETIGKDEGEAIESTIKPKVEPIENGSLSQDVKDGVEDADGLHEDEVIDEEDEEEDDEDEDDDEDDEDVEDFRHGNRTKEVSYSYSPNYCAVCSQYDPSFTQLTCQICSLSVHSKCYGISAKPNVNVPWHCDCCLNDKDNYADHIYQCDLCPVKLPNYAAWLTGETTGIPDALKRTWDGKWSHVRCAVWSPGVLFENSDWLQQVELYPHQEDECSLCMNKGHCMGCYICNTKLHPGCAGAKGYAMGIIFSPSKTGPVTWEGQPGHMEAAIICAAHEDAGETEEMIPMSEIDSTTDLTALQTYARNYKQAPQPELKGFLRRSLLHPGSTAEAVLVIPSTFADGDRKGDPLSFFHPDTNICVGCQTTQSAYWIRYPEGFTRCCYCYWKKRDNGHQLNIDTEYVIQNMKKIFNASVTIPKQAAPRSMRIQDILS